MGHFSVNEFRSAILELLQQSARTVSVEGNVDLLQSGILSSMQFLELVADLESKFSIEIDFTSAGGHAFTEIDGLAKLLEEAVHGRE